ncbi:M42 family metallopeptidase [Blattabacterium cuenoti]|nr:M42 family metallopeptidase [Blattabacterium cuenoti]
MDKTYYYINAEDIKFLQKYLNSVSPSGYESESQNIWKNYIKNYVNKITTDLYGTVVGILNPNNSPYKLIIEAHVDEISWYVNYISHNGMIYVSRNGGIDHQIATSKKIVIHTKQGLIYGVFGWPAIHTRKASSEEKSPNIDNIFIDVGAHNKKEVEKMGIHVGCLITYPDQFFIINKNYFVCRSLDNKIGGFIISQVLKKIVQDKINLKFGLYVVNSVQEEVGLKGAKIISNILNPNIVIVTDVTHDTSTPMIDKKIHGDIKCGCGPVIVYSTSIHRNLRELLINTANKNKLSFQHLVTSINTGTDTDAFAYSNKGVLSALISIPLKYMHTTVEMVHKNDVEKTVQLIFETIKEINHNEKNFFIY